METNNNPSDCPIPDYELTPNLNLEDAIKKREYLLDFPKPEFGFATGIELSIARTITGLNEIITNHVSPERKTKNGN